MPGDSPLHILVIEDDTDTQANLRDILELDDYQVSVAGTAGEALGSRDWSSFAAILLDRQLPDGTASELLPRLKELAPEAAVLIVTGYADLAGAIDALRQGAADYILKPINPDALRASLARVAERRRLALAKERSEAAFRTLVEAAPCMIVILRPDRSIAYFSPYAEKLTGYLADEVLGRDYFTLFLPQGNLQEATRQEIQGVLEGGSTREFETTVRSKDGSRRWMLWNVELLKNYEQGPVVLKVGQDITNLKQAQEQALRSERLATLGNMVAGLAHESRNALQLIQASLEMLALDVEDRPEAMKEVASIQAAEDRLHRLFEDIRGYAAPICLEREVCDIVMVWRAAWKQLAPLRTNRRVELHEHTGGAPLLCPVDLFSMERVFRNIFENALAACPDPVRIDVDCIEASLDGHPAVQVSVHDNGPGLDAEQRQKIFEPFYTTKRQGTGLGMAIAKRIVEAHGGQIRVDDEPPPGARIVVTVPRGPS